MSPAKEKLIQSLDMVDDETIDAIYAIVEKLLVIRDADYTFVTRAEDAAIQEGIAQIKRGEYVGLDDVVIAET
jgi:predicted transcriptional regulator